MTVSFATFEVQGGRLTQMNYENFRTCVRVAVIAGLLLMGAAISLATGAFKVSGSYQVLQKTDMGAETRVRLQIHLINRGQSGVRIQRLTLWDFPHPRRGQSRTSVIVVPAGGSADTIEEFTIPRSEYELWRRGTQPRLVVEAQTAERRSVTEAVRLARLSTGKAN